MKGLTEEGLRARIKDGRYELTELEAVDLWLLYPMKTELTWKKGNIASVYINGLNLEFSIIS